MTLEQFLALAQSGGAILTPVFVALWWFERDERRDAQAELKQVAKESAVAMTELKTLIGNLYVIFGSKNGMTS
jgi:hypothetical protein